MHCADKKEDFVAARSFLHMVGRFHLFRAYAKVFRVGWISAAHPPKYGMVDALHVPAL